MFDGGCAATPPLPYLPIVGARLLRLNRVCHDRVDEDNRVGLTRMAAGGTPIVAMRASVRWHASFWGKGKSCDGCLCWWPRSRPCWR
jgi:hypothetical protein